jgi:hypothetical protein
MSAQPWMKFYPQDWRADEQLRLCSLAARGLWIEMLAIMHRSERYGHLLIGGKVPTDAQLAIQAGALPHEVSELIGQLESAGVFSRAASGAIYSRRMTRDHKKAKIAQKNGRNGGNPTLRKQTDIPTSDKGEDKDTLILRGQKLDSVSNETGGEPPDIPKMIFALGVKLLTDAGTKQAHARSLLGKWRRDFGDSGVLVALTDCQAKNISNPVEWMPKRLAARPASFLDSYKARAA